VKKRRAYQEQAFWANKGLRRYFLAWLRQGGKTTTLAEQSLREMGEFPGRLITFATASLNLGTEMPEKEAQVWQQFMRDMQAWAAERKMQLVAGERRHASDADSWRQLPDDINVADLADVLVHNKFEVQLKHSNTVSSRLKVIAASVRTARGLTGSVKIDEAPFVEDLKTLMAEMAPIFSTDPTFSYLMAGTPPPDYADWSYELFSDENGNEEWEAKAEGNWFKNRAGIWVHRVTVDDAALAGRKNYHPDTGAEITPEEAREAESDKDGWDRSNRLVRPKVGTSAVSPVKLEAAQKRGKDRAMACEWAVDDDAPLDFALPAGLLEHCKGSVTLGLDLGTTTKEKSNPTALSGVMPEGDGFHTPFCAWWKTSDGRVTIGRVKQVVIALKAAGVTVNGLGIDGTSETLFARALREELADLCEVTIYIGGANVEGEKDIDGGNVNVKAFKGNTLSNLAESDKLSLPGGRGVYDDFMLVKKRGGTFDASIGSQGQHGDVFDSVALGIIKALKKGSVEAYDMPVGDAGGMSGSRSPHPSWRREELGAEEVRAYG
jgi:hypothetical protein